MINFDTLRNNLYDWAVDNLPTDTPVIYLYPNAPRPTVDYISLLLSSFNQIGWDYTQDPLDDSGVAELVGDREFILQVQGYGGDPMSLLEGLRTSLQKQTVLDSLRANGIVFVSWFPISDITALIDSRFEKRASMDVKFRLAQVYSDDLGVINTVELEEIFENAQGNVLIDETIQIPT